MSIFLTILLIIAILFSVYSGNVDARPAPLKESCHTSLGSLQITITLALVDFFLQSGLKNCWHGLVGIEPRSLDISSHPGAYDLMATPSHGDPYKATEL